MNAQGTAARILVVDDDTALAEMIGIVLRTEGFEPFFCADGAKAVDEFHASQPDLVLLDLMLPGMDGIEVCARIREESGVPIIMLTAKSDTADVVKGLECGADDYVVKPFNPKELVARIRTRLRPTPETSHRVPSRIGDLVLDVAGHEVRRGEDPHQPHAARVRAAARARAQAAAGVHPRDAARAGVGLPLQGRHPAGERARAAPAREGRGGPGQPAHRHDRARRRLPRGQHQSRAPMRWLGLARTGSSASPGCGARRCSCAPSRSRVAAVRARRRS